ncbi:tetratricopeptide repeat protein, partial [candidate division WOR-3 bacterium]|nr:tetratricopeptide repeat protein [candidate division WOR-3 bacterium]
LSQHLDPEEVSDAVNTCFEILNPIIIKHGGTIHKYEGDLVIALFGFPVTHEDDPERAIKASLEMFKYLPEINKKLTIKLQKKTQFGLHIGINSGRVMVAEIGSREKKEHTVMGDVVNLASRLKDAAKQGEIFVSESVYRASHYLFDYQTLPPIKVKGYDTEIQVFKPLSIKKKPESKRGIRGLYSPLVSREKELKLLLESVENLRQGKGGAVFILGDTGVGKSRLFLELKNIIQKSHMPITLLQGYGVSYGEKVAYLPFLHILKHIFNIDATDSVKTVKEKLKKKIIDTFPKNWKNILPYLGYLFSVRFGGKLDERIRYLDAQGLKLQIFLSIRKLLFALSKKEPILLVFEDFHWIDYGSQELLQFIFNARGSSSLLFMGISRVEKKKDSWRLKERLKKTLGRASREFILKPLDYESSKQLISNLLKICKIPDEFRDRILSKAEGNPFYLEEILRSLIDAGTLTYVPKTWRLSLQTLSSDEEKATLSSIAIPNTVYGVIAARIDMLEPETKEVFQIASVIGQTFSQSILENVSAIDRSRLYRYLNLLENLDYITCHKKEHDFKYTFKHSLFQEIAYKTLLKRKRIELHQKVGVCIERLFKKRLSDVYELLSHQYYAAKVWDKAYEYSTKAAKKNKELYNNKVAIQFFETAIDALKNNKARIKERIKLTREKAEVLNLIGKQNAALKDIKLTIDLAKKVGDKLEHAKCIDVLCRIYVHTAQHKMMEKSALESLDLYKKLKEKKGEAVSLKNIARVYWRLGKYPEALKYFKLSSKLYKNTKDISGKAESLRGIGAAHHCLCNYKKALEYYNQSLKGHVKTDSRKDQSTTLNNIGIVYKCLGKYEKANEYYQDSLKIATEIGYRYGMAVTLNNIANIYRDLEDYTKAMDFYKKSLLIHEEVNDRRGEAICSLNIGISYYNLGDSQKALNFFQGSLTKTKAIGDRQLEACILNNLGHFFRDIGNYQRAMELYKNSIKVATKIGDRRIEPENLIGLGSLYLEKKNYHEAEKYFKKAHATDKNAKSHLNQADILYCLSSLYLEKKDRKNAEVFYRNLQKCVANTNLKEPKAKALCLSGRLYRSKSAFEDSIDIFKKMKSSLELAKVYYYYGILLREQSKKKKASGYFKQAKRIFEKIGAKDWTKKVNIIQKKSRK